MQGRDDSVKEVTDVKEDEIHSDIKIDQSKKRNILKVMTSVEKNYSLINLNKYEKNLSLIQLTCKYGKIIYNYII